MQTFVAAVDQGTTGTRCMIFTRDGRVHASAYREHRQLSPRPGWVEHNPMEIWETTQAVIREAMAQGEVGAEQLAAIGITNQRETTVVWERATGRPVHNAIVWQDTRTRELCQRIIDDGFDDHIRRVTGLRSATYFSGPKLAWLLDHVPGLRARAERGEVLFGTIDTWLIWRLTGGPSGGAHVTDYTNASRTMLMDLSRLEWDAEILAYLRIPVHCLPQIRPSSDRAFYGTTRADGPLGGVVPVCGDLGDQQAALAGQVCFEVGDAKNTYGTGNFMLLNTGGTPVPSSRGLLTTGAYGVEEGRCTYALEGSIAVTGAAVQWLRDNLGLISAAAETEAVAQSVPDSGGVYFVPAFSGLFAPYWDMDARGVIVGLTRFADRRHLVRATLEAICYQTREVLDAMRADAGIPLTVLKVDGGAVRNNFLMQLQADILGVPVIRPTVSETTALGAAYMAGLAVGVWRDLADLRRNWQVDRIFEPVWSEDRREAGYRLWRRAVERARGWLSPS
ncbi:MAG: glycerol kinase GlpK [Armatimonadota bacterium]|nr:glycerol kinase GlpK [Armatimonadota bacterium]MDR7452251.1 glycerol kinase GlpK [Armatimonadota bacterium]MDR7466654.1 glycerol kinase GlpK [Armatimonadota bacterium]MDR7492872.1 glycerol kinase GlpK [Armatimonadota bacterium]MDR7498648.1 glycerol kinase GlpK [Armatimonadota bacterium]